MKNCIPHPYIFVQLLQDSEAREERHSYILLIAFLMPHCPVTVVQRYRDGVCSLNLPSIYPPSFRRNDFLYIATT